MEGNNNNNQQHIIEFGSSNDTMNTNPTYGKACLIPPPPMGYPVKDSQPDAVTIEMSSKGDVVQGYVAVVLWICAFDAKYKHI
ncbi:hypothetical protein V2J09_002417 [Rumex salicifolius]